MTNKVNISGVTIIFHIINKHEKEPGDYFDVLLWHLDFCQYTHNACMIRVTLSYFKS